MLRYSKKTARGFTWTRDFKSGSNGFCIHRLYFEGHHTLCVATINRKPKRQHYTLTCGKAKSKYNELDRAKKVAENFAMKNWRKLGFKLVRA